MADRERNDLRQQIVTTRQVLEAHERRRALLQQKRPHGVRASGAGWARERPVRLLVTAAVVLLGVAGSVAPSSVPADEWGRPSGAAQTETARDVPAEATVTLHVAGADGAEDPDAGSVADPSDEPGGAPVGVPGEPPATDPDGSSGDQGTQSASSGPPEPATAGETDSATSSPTPAPELSDTGETDDGSTSEPEPTQSPEPDSPDDDADGDEETCLGVNALGLTVDLCVQSLLAG